MKQRSYIYCLLAVPIGRVKIGYSTNPLSRANQIKGASAFPISLMGLWPGGKYEESDIHDRFQHLRQSGEWFELDAELLDFIINQSACVDSDTCSIGGSIESMLNFQPPTEPLSAFVGYPC